MNIGSIASSLIGFASGGWGSAVAILMLMIGAAWLYWKYKKYLQEKAGKDTQDQAAVDESNMIAENQKQNGQIQIDDHENLKLLEEAKKKLEAAVLPRPNPDETRP